MLATEVTKESIMDLMESFYERIRHDIGPLGDIFREHVAPAMDNAAWEAHKIKIGSFWERMLLGTGDYYGQPLMVHKDLPPFPRDLFGVWLGMFKESLNEVFVEEIAEDIFARANGIAFNFQRFIYEK